MMTPDALEVLMSRKLAGLPGPRAPASLLPRVMREVREASRSPATVPRPGPWTGLARFGAAAAWIVVAGLLALRWDSAPVAEAVAVVDAVQFLWRVALAPNIAYFALVIGAIGACGVLFCAALSRILWEGSTE